MKNKLGILIAFDLSAQCAHSFIEDKTMKNKFKLGAVALAMVSAGLFSAGAAQADAIISNGTVQIGVRDLGDLNVVGGTAANGSGTTIVGLRSVLTNSDSTSPGCTCEGWGVGVRSLGISGYANSAVGTRRLSENKSGLKAILLSSGKF